VPIPSHVYDRDYFLSEWCEGFDDFKDGRGLSRVKQKQLALFAPQEGEVILDAGCGRGEFLLACARLGARVAGLDYSEAAVQLSRETLADVPGADIRHGDVTALPWPDESFDRIVFADVIEHLDPDQAEAALAELHRVLKPGGLLLLHTAPNRLFLEFTWPLIRPVLRVLGRGTAVDDLDSWIEGAARYHVNEQTVFSLRRSLRSVGFRQPRVWIDPDVLREGEHRLTDNLDDMPVMRLGARLAALRPVRLFLGNDLFAAARRLGGQA
jgi:ubiquinone/menaquinone biosynthesis C-methylase UbiE